MRLLLTNDDGVSAPGLAILARELQSAGHQVLVVAPDREYSGSGASIAYPSEDAGVSCEEVVVPGLADVPTIALAGPPALCVTLGLSGAFGHPPDVVVSGVNPELNVGTTVMHSGTVGAAITAAALGRQAVALSTASGDPALLTATARAAVRGVSAIDLTIAPRVVSVNVPPVAAHGPVPAHATTVVPQPAFALLAVRAGDNVRIDPVWADGPFPEGTDAAAIAAGTISVTVFTGLLHADLSAAAPFAEAIGATDRSTEPRPLS